MKLRRLLARVFKLMVLCLFSTSHQEGEGGEGGLQEPERMHMYSTRRFPARHQTNVSAASERAGEEGGGSDGGESN